MQLLHKALITYKVPLIGNPVRGFFFCYYIASTFIIC